MKVLVTGGNGFIGRHVVSHLLSRGHSPLVFDRHVLEHNSGSFTLGDIRNANSVTDAMAHVDGFIHMAGLLGTQETIQNPLPAAETNVLGGLNVLQAAAQYGVPGAFITVGNFFMDNTYAITKTAVERFCRMYNNERGTKINVVRVVNAYGPGQAAAAPYGPAKVRKIAPAIICRALCNAPIEIYGNGQQVSDMVYVGDVAFTLVRALEEAALGNVTDKPVEAGSIDHTTVNDFANVVIDETHSESGISYLPMRPGEISGARVTADVSTLWQLKVDPWKFTTLSYGVRETVKWFIDNEGVTWHRP